MKTTRPCVFVLFTFIALAFLPNSFAQKAIAENTVRIIYFLPNDRQPQPDINAKLDTLIKDLQQFYADEMERHGFGRKTFTFETDSRRNAVVHRVNGQFTAQYYYNQTWDKAWDEIQQQYDLSKNIYFTAMDINSDNFEVGETGHGKVCGKGGVFGIMGGRILIPASGKCFVGDTGYNTAAHELGHGFGLVHNFHSETYIMSYGPYPHEFSLCTAEYLDVHPYFNTTQSVGFNHLTTVEMFPPVAAPSDTIRFRFKVTDANGIHQTQLLTLATDVHEALGEPKLLGCKQVNKQTNTVEYDIATHLITQTEMEIALLVVDAARNVTESHFVTDMAPLLPADKVVSIPDTNLAAVIRGFIGLAPKEVITQQELLKLTELFVDGPQIKDLTGIEKAKNLKILAVTNTSVSDWTILTEMTNLSYLGIIQNGISDLSPIAGLTNLTWLDLYENQIRDITPLTGLTQLYTLQMYENEISDLTPIAGLTQLRILALEHNRIRDLTPLADLKYLKTLLLGNTLNPTSSNNNQVHDLTPLTELADMEFLNLMSNRVNNITPLAGMTKLRQLWLGGNQIRDVTAVAGLVNLERLILWGNPIQDTAPLRSLIQKKPDLDVDIDPRLYVEITGPWLWMIAPTIPGQGGAPSTDVDSLAVTSGVAGTEADIATNGANTEERVGSYSWTLAEIRDVNRNGWSDNITDVVHRLGWAAGDINDYSSYALITLESATAQKDVRMQVGSDDSIKVWLNGLVVHNNPVNRGSDGFQDPFLVNLMPGDNLLLVKVSDATGNWSMFVGIDADAKVTYKPYSADTHLLTGDVNNDGSVNVLDLILVGSQFGKSGESDADVNKDGIVNIADLVLVAGALGNAAAAPAMSTLSMKLLTARKVKQWLSEAESLEMDSSNYQIGVQMLEHLLMVLTPKHTALLSNYPNPFNPETWIPYQLSAPADVTLRIYAANGELVRTLALGHKPTGIYQRQSRAAYWDGTNELGEPVASGIYFYTLSTDDFTATRKMLILK